MMHLSQLLKKIWQTRSLSKILVLVILVGIADTAYLTINHYSGGDIKCIITEGCEVVLTSQYSKIFSIPLAVLGLAFYTGMFVIANLYDIYKEKYVLKLVTAGGAVGFVMSLMFLYLQLFVLKAFCFYCLTSLVSSTTIFVLAIISLKNYRKIET